MPVAAADMKLFLSGGSANSDPNAALGGVKSSVEHSGTALNSMFDDVTEPEASAGLTDYRCFYLMNDHATDTINAVKFFIQSNTPSSTTKFQIGLEPAGGVAQTIANETTAPTGVTFSDAANAGAALDVGNMDADDYWGIWFKRIIDPGTASAASDPVQFKMTGTPV